MYHILFNNYFSKHLCTKKSNDFQKEKKPNIIYRLNISGKCHGVIFNISRIIWHLGFNVKCISYYIYVLIFLEISKYM